MKTFSTVLLAMSLTTLLNAPALVAAPIPDDCKTGGFAVGCQAWTFNHFTAYEAVEKTALAGAKVIEFYPGQKLSAEHPDLKWDHDASDETIAAMKAHLAKHGLRPVNYGVVHGKDEAEWRKIFEFAKKLDLYAITTEDVNQLDAIEKLVKEFDIRVAIHNHPQRPNDANYKVWDPNYILSVVKDRDPRIGACADIGHWATSGIKPLDAVKLLKGRIVSSHFKDRLAIGKQTPDQPFGSGISDIKGILDEFRAQGFNGNISIEYETKWDNSLPDVAQCVGFFRGYGSCQ
ncbi:MAG: sugar phosphate isomerase/epimerase [Verrucomicrobia bacterium]|nr:MAG: sugar phosphate isomerase/epimerase [Verrucomicrobiota bacterium]